MHTNIFSLYILYLLTVDDGKYIQRHLLQMYDVRNKYNESIVFCIVSYKYTQW